MRHLLFSTAAFLAVAGLASPSSANDRIEVNDRIEQWMTGDLRAVPKKQRTTIDLGTNRRVLRAYAGELRKLGTPNGNGKADKVMALINRAERGDVMKENSWFAARLPGDSKAEWAVADQERVGALKEGKVETARRWAFSQYQVEHPKVLEGMITEQDVRKAGLLPRRNANPQKFVQSPRWAAAIGNRLAAVPEEVHEAFKWNVVRPARLTSWAIKKAVKHYRQAVDNVLHPRPAPQAGRSPAPQAGRRQGR